MKPRVGSSKCLIKERKQTTSIKNEKEDTNQSLHCELVAGEFCSHVMLTDLPIEMKWKKKMNTY